jgi:hypothetical protein
MQPERATRELSSSDTFCSSLSLSIASFVVAAPPELSKPFFKDYDK